MVGRGYARMIRYAVPPPSLVPPHPLSFRHGRRDPDTRRPGPRPAFSGPARARRIPRHIRRRDDHHAPARAGGFRPAVRVRAGRRPADRDQGAGRGNPERRARPGAARRHRIGQDLHRRACDPPDQAADPDPRPEQDAGRPALWRDEGAVPRERGRIFRQLLRLLPARGLCPALRHLYREGKLDQRADRPHAPLGDARAAGARRCDHRRLGVLHLRHRVGRDLFDHDLPPCPRRGDRAAVAAAPPDRAAIPAQRHQFRARHLPRARRQCRAVPGPPRGPRLADLAVRRRDRGDVRDRPADRREDGEAGDDHRLRQFALCDAAADIAAGDQADPQRAEDPHRRLHRAGQAAGGAAHRAAHAVRYRDDRGHRVLRRHRELLALFIGARARRAAADTVRISAGKRAADHR